MSVRRDSRDGDGGATTVCHEQEQGAGRDIMGSKAVTGRKLGCGVGEGEEVWRKAV